MYNEKDFTFRMWAWICQEMNEAVLGAVFNAEPLFG
jgi:hypothetical protein